MEIIQDDLESTSTTIKDPVQIISVDTHEVVSHIIRNSTVQSLTLRRILEITEEALNRQISMLWASEYEKQLIKTNLIPVAGKIVKYLENQEWEAQDSLNVRGYLATQDITELTTKSAHLESLCKPSETHIGIYLWRIQNENEFINTLNHEINHWYFRYITTLRSSHYQKSLLQINWSAAYKIIIECLGHLTGAEATIVKWSNNYHDGIQRAGWWSNGDIMDPYTLGSLLAQKLLAVQILLGKQTGSHNANFIHFCNEYRNQLMNSAYKPERLTSLFNLLKITDTNYKVNNNTLLSILDWMENR